MRVVQLSEIPSKDVKQKRGKGKAGSRDCIVRTPPLPLLFFKKEGIDLTKYPKKGGWKNY